MKSSEKHDASQRALLLKDNVKVAVRARPLQDEEHEFLVIGDNCVTIPCIAQAKSSKHSQEQTSFTYSFDQVLPIVNECFSGYDCAVFAFGQTGSGKTYTIEGKHTDSGGLDPIAIGLIPRTLHYIFTILQRVCPRKRSTELQINEYHQPLAKHAIADSFSKAVKSVQIPRFEQSLFGGKEVVDYQITVSNVEIYNELLSDLLVDEQKPTSKSSTLTSSSSASSASGSSSQLPRGKSDKKLSIIYNLSGEVVVQGLRGEVVNNLEEALFWFKEGCVKRSTAGTVFNDRSSRSHAIFTINVLVVVKKDKDSEEVITGKINFVDLAGSEGAGKAKYDWQNQKEAGSINQSMLTLSKVITALQNNDPYIPYRESNLTRLLQNSLGGNGKTLMIATIDLSEANAEHSRSTLAFATRTKSIRNKPKINVSLTTTSIIKGMQAEIQRLKKDLQQQIERDGGCFVSEEDLKALGDCVEDAKHSSEKVDVWKEEIMQKLKCLEDTVDKALAAWEKDIKEKLKNMKDKLEEEQKSKKEEINEKCCIIEKMEKKIEELEKEKKLGIEENKMLKEENEKLSNEKKKLAQESDELLREKEKLHKRYLEVITEKKQKEELLSEEANKKREIGEKFLATLVNWEEQAEKRRKVIQQETDFQKAVAFLKWAKETLIPQSIDSYVDIFNNQNSNCVSKEQSDLMVKRGKEMQSEAERHFDEMLKVISEQNDKLKEVEESQITLKKMMEENDEEEKAAKHSIDEAVKEMKMGITSIGKIISKHRENNERDTNEKTDNEFPVSGSQEAASSSSSSCCCCGKAVDDLSSLAAQIQP
ncbi:kinesin, unidentified [Monocercomonoides exilis]|uniref:kinesin, unidentified n=1 Tax=Monocercomonoides exilis TaxID=2049356 RepID=UPI00355ABE20|nr:kinesin, unidentified [Monocercomonoides exilis]|eukprot:MONOS_3389.1-p1 / transcript=MONOS_3389.1 / gene=MONOS_3389 / organism=Monocercomonoides_exilis_PA203 / gene_product=kinesin, unidentified / transcript_product=kinesin, unidentified / location=Mono_scaffold00079:111716-114351(-) / protein_length=817 / sequence_SO=supercontig / SO=protein_coding / is_pseudo=false